MSQPSAHQYEPLRTPSGWTGDEKRLIAQLTEIFDDIYRRWGRLRFEDMARGFRQRIEDDEGRILEVEQTAAGLVVRVTGAEGRVNTLELTTEGLKAAVDNRRLVFDARGLRILNSSGGVVFEQDIDTGNLTIQGVIKALGGVIGGFTITEGGLVNENNKIRLLSTGDIVLGNLRLVSDHSSISYVDDAGNVVFSAGEGSFIINQTFFANGPVYMTDLPVTVQPANLYVDATGKLYRSVTGGTGSSLSVTVTAQPSSVEVGGGVTVGAQVTGQTGAYTLTLTLYRNGQYVRGLQHTNGIASFQADAAGMYEIYAQVLDSAGQAAAGWSNSVSVGGGGGGTALGVSGQVNTPIASIGQPVTWSWTVTGGTPGYRTSYTVYRNGAIYFGPLNTTSATWSHQLTITEGGTYQMRCYVTDEDFQTAEVFFGPVSVGGGGSSPTSGRTKGENVIIRERATTESGSVETIGTKGTQVQITGALKPDETGGSIPWWPVYWVYDFETYIGYIRSDLIDPIY